MHGGASITQTLEEVPMRKGKNAGKLRQHEQQRLLERLLNGGKAPVRKGQFRDPGAMFGKEENNS
jgi:hypothetical protein